MEHRLSRFGVAATLGLLVTVFALLLVTPTQARHLLAGGGTVLSEGFENATFPPANWELNVITGTSTYTWTRVSSGSSPSASPHGGGWMARYYGWLASSGAAARLATPVLNFSSLTSPSLKFWFFHSTNTGAGRMDIQLSTDGDLNYTTVLTTIMRNNGTTGWKLYTVDLSPYIGQTNVRLGFLAVSDYNGNMYLDDVSVGDPAPNYVAQKSVAPSGARNTGDVVTYTVSFTNTGELTGTASLNDPIPAGAQVVPDSVTGGAVYSEALNAVIWSPISLAPNNSVTATFRVTLTAINGSVTNTATISDAAILAPVSASAANAIVVADFSSSSKTISSANMHPTGLVTYTVVVYNSVAAITATATLTDPIPAGAAYLPGSASVQGGGTLVADTAGITWTGTVTGGQRITVTFGVSLTALTGNVINTAYITSPYINALVTKAASFPVQPYSAGPTPFGYLYQDSYAPGGPAFTWVEPLTTSKLITFASGGTNDGYYEVNLPFPLAFYTNIYTQVYPGTNGLVGFGAGSTVAANATIPTSAAPNNFAACYWDDLRIWSTNPITEGVYYEVQGIAPNRQAIFTFALEDASYTSGAYPPYRFQMVLSEGTNQITCHYQQMTSAAPRGDGRSATIGLENAAGTEGLLYFYGSGTTFPAPIEDRLAIRYTPPQRPNYAFAKTVQPAGMVYPGQVLTYSLTITNFGGLNGTVTISDPLPAGVVFVGPVPGDPLQPVFDGYAVTWTGPVPTAQSVTVRFLAGVLPSLSGLITNTATISDSLIPAPLTAQVSNSVARSIYTTSSKTVTPAGTVSTGQLLTYTVSIINSGALSGTAQLIDTPVAGTTYVPGSAVIVSGGGSIIASGTTVTWTGTVTNGATIQVRLNAIVSGSYGVITNTATITDATIAAPVYVSVANTIASPILSVSTKTANPSAVQVGGALTYTVLVKNTGVLTSTAASLTDALLPQFTLDPAKLSASSGVVTGTASSVSWNGTVAPGATVAVTIPVVVSNDCCGQALTNTAVISDPVQPVPVNAVAAPVLIYGANIAYSESFENAFPPSGWATTVITAVGTANWTQVITGDVHLTIPSGPYAGAYMARFGSYYDSGAAIRLSSGPISLVGVDHPMAGFAMYHDPSYSSSPDRIQPQISTDGGGSYQNIETPIYRWRSVAGWQFHVIDLSAYSGQTIRLGFLAISAAGNDMYLDAVNVYACGFAPLGVSFTFDPTSPLAGQSIDFDGAVSSGTAPFTYTWDFGDGSLLTTGDPITHSYALAGTYPVTLTVTNQYGSASYSASLVVSPVPVPPALTLVSSSPTVLGTPTYFTATLQTGSLPITYTWNFGDGAVVNDGLIANHTYAAGTYTAILTATNVAGQAVVTTTVDVGAGPTASFDHNSPVNAPNTTVVFTHTGGNATAWLWNFGDGLTSTLQNPTHTYAVPPAQTAQVYTVTLTAANAYGAVQNSALVTVTNYFAVLSGVKLGPPAVSTSGSLLVYTIRVTNTGGLPANNTSLVDTFPIGTTGPAVNVSVSQGSLSMNTASGLTWNGALAGSESLTLTFSLTPTVPCGGQVLTNTAVISDPVIAAPLALTAAGTQLAGGVALHEGFDGAAFPPAGWSTAVVTDTGTQATPIWSRITSGSNPSASPHSGAAMAKFNSYDADSGDAVRLSAPALDFSTVAHPIVQFWMYHDTGYPSNADRIQVQASTDGGTTYTNVGAAVTRYDGSVGWKLHTVDLVAYGGLSSVRVAFLGIGGYGSNIFMDDTAVVQPCATTTTLASAANPAVAGQTVTFTATVTPLAATGTVQFYADSSPLLGAIAVFNGTAQISIDTLPVGTHVITATYSGDASYLPSTAAPLNQVVAAACDPVTGTDASWLPVTPTAGQPVNFTVVIMSGTLPITYTWNFGHGADVITTASSVVHSFPLTNTAQAYTVTLAAANACSTQAAAPKLLTVQPLRVYLPLILK